MLSALILAILTIIPATVAQAPVSVPVSASNEDGDDDGECDPEASAGKDGCAAGTTCAMVTIDDGGADLWNECVPIECIGNNGSNTDAERPHLLVEEWIDDCKAKQKR